MQTVESLRQHFRKKPILLATLVLVPVLVAALVLGPGIIGRARAITNFAAPGTGMKGTEVFRPLFMYDIINQVNNRVTTSNFDADNQSWIGSGSNMKSYLALRTFGNALPEGAVVTSAKLELKSARNSKVEVSVDVGVATGMSDSDPNDIFGEFKPSELTLGSIVQNQTLNNRWVKDSFVEMDVTDVVKEYFTGNPTSRLVTLVFKNAAENTRSARRFFYSNTLQTENAPKLTIEYVVGGQSSSTSVTTTSSSSTSSSSSSSSSSATSTTTSAPPVQVNNRAEIGMDLAMYNRLRTEAVSGAYDRECTEAEHDPTKWHSLINEEAKCHYDHQHFDDPNYVNDIFGEPGAWFGKAGQSISYPWQTFPAQTANESNAAYAGQLENDIKHEEFAWIVRRDQDCSQGDCVRDYRLLVHMDGNLHATTRYHSFSLEARYCRNGNDLSTCGIVRFGGWADYGRLLTSSEPNNLDCSHANRNFVPLPADNLFFPIDRPEARDEIRCHPFITSLPAYPSSIPMAEWWAKGGGGYRGKLFLYDPMGNVNPDDPTEFHTFCNPTDADCDYNGSILTAVLDYTEAIPEFFDGMRVDEDQNERTDLMLGDAYFNRWGGRNASCTGVSLDCIPFEFNNVPLNIDYNKNGRFEEARYKQIRCENCEKLDYDIAPAGKQWITWFYDHLDHDMPEVEIDDPA